MGPPVKEGSKITGIWSVDRRRNLSGFSLALRGVIEMQCHGARNI